MTTKGWKTTGRRLVRVAVSLLIFTLAGSPPIGAHLLVGTIAGDPNHAVLRYTATTGSFVEIFVAEGSGGLLDPEGMAFGPNGDLYVSSYGSDAVLRYDGKSGALVGTFVTAGSGGLSGPLHLLFRGDHLYVTSCGTGEVLRYDSTSGAFVDAFVASEVDCPTGLAFGLDGNLYVSDFSGPIRRFDGTTGAFSTELAGGGFGLTLGPDGRLYAAGGDGTVTRYDGTSGTFIDTFASAPPGDTSDLWDLAFGFDGHLYTSDQDGRRVLKYDGSSGAYLGEFVPHGRGGLGTPTVLLFDAVIFEDGFESGGTSRWASATP